jgi:CcmD family protein
MKRLSYFLTSLLFLCITVTAGAQDTNDSKVGEFMRSNQRSYVVIAVMLTILIGLILYLVRLDRKISKLEKE